MLHESIKYKGCQMKRCTDAVHLPMKSIQGASLCFLCWRERRDFRFMIVRGQRYVVLYLGDDFHINLIC